jgi:hypothetical protein
VPAIFYRIIAIASVERRHDLRMSLSGAILAGSVSLSVQPEGQGRSEPPKIAWGSDIFNRSGRDLKARSSAKLNSHTSSEGYSMSCPLLCTESETDPLRVRISNFAPKKTP